MKAGYRCAFIATLALTAACTVHGTDVPSLAGPSEAALAVSMTVTPDTVVQDGRSQATVTVTARDVSGAAKSGQSFRLDTEVGDAATGLWARHDFGVLSARTLTTGSDGRASAVFTTPEVNTAGFEGLIRFVASPIGTDYAFPIERTAQLKLIPPSGYRTPGPVPLPSFYVTPTPVYVGVPVNFNATASCPETPADGQGCTTALTITNYIWDFGDGTGGTGFVTNHTFTAEGTYRVLLRVINSRGVHGLLSQTIDVKFPPGPKAEFSVAPTPPRAGTVTFDASLSTAGAGRSLVQYEWYVNGGLVGTGVSFSANLAAGSYNVTLAVYDDTGQKNVKSSLVTVAP